MSEHNNINGRDACFNLRKASRAVTQYFDHSLEPSGVRATQFTLLVTLASVSAKTLTEMAEHLVMDRTTLTRNLKPLEKLNLIQIVTAKDKRSKAYALTDHGRSVLERSVPLWEAAQRRVEEQLGLERYQKLLTEMSAITKIFEHM